MKAVFHFFANQLFLKDSSVPVSLQCAVQKRRLGAPFLSLHLSTGKFILKVTTVVKISLKGRFKQLSENNRIKLS